MAIIINLIVFSVAYKRRETNQKEKNNNVKQVLNNKYLCHCVTTVPVLVDNSRLYCLELWQLLLLL